MQDVTAAEDLPKELQSISVVCGCFACCLVLITLESFSSLSPVNLWGDGVSLWREHEQWAASCAVQWGHSL